METMKIGYIAISKASWMTPKIDAIAKRTFEALQTLPAEILYHGVTTTEGEAAARAEEFARAGVDTVVMHFVTFPVGATIPAAATRLDVPFILLANPEEPGPGKMWEQNSFCGANMAAHGLNRLRKRYCFVMARPEETAEALKKPLAVVRAVKMLRNLRIGLAGGRVPGFYTSNFDELLLRREFGVAVEVLDLLEIVKTADTLTEAELAAARKVVKESAAKVNAVSAADLELAAKMYGSFRKTAEKYQLSTYAVRCWPEFSDLFGIAPCAVLGMLSDTGFATSCEGDVTGAFTMKLLQALPVDHRLVAADDACRLQLIDFAAYLFLALPQHHGEVGGRHRRDRAGELNCVIAHLLQPAEGVAHPCRGFDVVAETEHLGGNGDLLHDEFSSLLQPTTTGSMWNHSQNWSNSCLTSAWMTA